MGDSLIIYNIKNSLLYIEENTLQGNERIGLKLTFLNKFKYGKDYLPIKITQFREKRFYKRETIRSIRISPYWLKFLTNYHELEKG